MILRLPRVFISSTILDFRDLRSALKFWLEQLGYEVMLSEFSDFDKPLDQSSYDACLQTLTTCDYYILLVGSRVGALYDANNGISITRREYRTAYELAKAHKLKIVTFIRQDIWNVWHDRQALTTLLQTQDFLDRELDEEKIRKIALHSSSVIQSAAYIFDFINEVGRQDEVAKAAAGLGAFPIANWIHPFSAFQEIVDVLQVMFNIRHRLSRVALLSNLRRELLGNLSILVYKHGTDILPKTVWGDRARSEYRSQHEGTLEMQARFLSNLSIYLLFSETNNQLSTTYIDHGLLSGELLEYSSDIGGFKETLLSDGLFQLKKNIERLRRMHFQLKDHHTSFMARYSDIDRNSVVNIDSKELTMFMAMYDCETNVVNLTSAVIKALDGNTENLKVVDLLPPSPIPKEAEQIKSEQASLEELQRWISDL